ncbi:hypothetical protein HMPREF3198_00399 [Winkia neuii]|nr:hypothetical protein HMPREF3198_00399 [Winkia neuii]
MGRRTLFSKYLFITRKIRGIALYILGDVGPTQVFYRPVGTRRKKVVEPAR